MDALNEALDRLSDLDRTTLRKRWVAMFNVPVPKYLSIPMMRRMIAFELQAAQLGGLAASTRRKLESHRRAGAKPAPQIHVSGTKLVREWNGVSHVVEVEEEGFQWQGKHYRSLSAIAREITGARWSGPRFFQTGKGQGQ